MSYTNGKTFELRDGKNINSFAFSNFESHEFIWADDVHVKKSTSEVKSQRDYHGNRGDSGKYWQFSSHEFSCIVMDEYLHTRKALLMDWSRGVPNDNKSLLFYWDSRQEYLDTKLNRKVHKKID